MGESRLETEFRNAFRNALAEDAEGVTENEDVLSKAKGVRRERMQHLVCKELAGSDDDVVSSETEKAAESIAKQIALNKKWRPGLVWQNFEEIKQAKPKIHRKQIRARRQCPPLASMISSRKKRQHKRVTPAPTRSTRTGPRHQQEHQQ
jgi:hypothetical protein